MILFTNPISFIWSAISRSIQRRLQTTAFGKYVLPILDSSIVWDSAAKALLFTTVDLNIPQISHTLFGGYSPSSNLQITKACLSNVAWSLPWHLSAKQLQLKIRVQPTHPHTPTPSSSLFSSSEQNADQTNTSSSPFSATEPTDEYVAPGRIERFRRWLARSEPILYLDQEEVLLPAELSPTVAELFTMVSAALHSAIQKCLIGCAEISIELDVPTSSHTYCLLITNPKLSFDSDSVPSWTLRIDTVSLSDNSEPLITIRAGADAKGGISLSAGLAEGIWHASFEFGIIDINSYDYIKSLREVCAAVKSPPSTPYPPRSGDLDPGDMEAEAFKRLLDAPDELKQFLINEFSRTEIPEKSTASFFPHLKATLNGGAGSDLDSWVVNMHNALSAIQNVCSFTVDIQSITLELAQGDLAVHAISTRFRCAREDEGGAGTHLKVKSIAIETGKSRHPSIQLGSHSSSLLSRWNLDNQNSDADTEAIHASIFLDGKDNLHLVRLNLGEVVIQAWPCLEIILRQFGSQCTDTPQPPTRAGGGGWTKNGYLQDSHPSDHGEVRETAFCGAALFVKSITLLSEIPEDSILLAFIGSSHLRYSPSTFTLESEGLFVAASPCCTKGPFSLLGSTRQGVDLNAFRFVSSTRDVKSPSIKIDYQKTPKPTSAKPLNSSCDEEPESARPGGIQAECAPSFILVKRGSPLPTATSPQKTSTVSSRTHRTCSLHLTLADCVVHAHVLEANHILAKHYEWWTQKLPDPKTIPAAAAGLSPADVCGLTISAQHVSACFSVCEQFDVDCMVDFQCNDIRLMASNLFDQLKLQIDTCSGSWTPVSDSPRKKLLEPIEGATGMVEISWMKDQHFDLRFSRAKINADASMINELMRRSACALGVSTKSDRFASTSISMYLAVVTIELNLYECLSTAAASDWHQVIDDHSTKLSVWSLKILDGVARDVAAGNDMRFKCSLELDLKEDGEAVRVLNLHNLELSNFDYPLRTSLKSLQVRFSPQVIISLMRTLEECVAPLAALWLSNQEDDMLSSSVYDPEAVAHEQEQDSWIEDPLSLKSNDPDAAEDDVCLVARSPKIAPEDAPTVVMTFDLALVEIEICSLSKLTSVDISESRTVVEEGQHCETWNLNLKDIQILDRVLGSKFEYLLQRSEDIDTLGGSQEFSLELKSKHFLANEGGGDESGNWTSVAAAQSQEFDDPESSVPTTWISQLWISLAVPDLWLTADMQLISILEDFVLATKTLQACWSSAEIQLDSVCNSQDGDGDSMPVKCPDGQSTMTKSHYMIRSFQAQPLNLRFDFCPKPLMLAELSTGGSLAALNCLAHLCSIESLEFPLKRISVEGLMTPRELMARVFHAAVADLRRGQLVKYAMMGTPVFKSLVEISNAIRSLITESFSGDQTHTTTELDELTKLRKIRELFSGEHRPESWLEVDEPDEHQVVVEEEDDPTTNGLILDITSRLCSWANEQMMLSVGHLLDPSSSTKAKLASNSTSLLRIVALESLKISEALCRNCSENVNALETKINQSGNKSSQRSRGFQPLNRPDSEVWSVVDRGANSFYEPEDIGEGLQDALIQVRRGITNIGTIYPSRGGGPHLTFVSLEALRAMGGILPLLILKPIAICLEASTSAMKVFKPMSQTGVPKVFEIRALETSSK